MHSSDYNKFQEDFTNAVKQKYNEGLKSNPELLGPNILLNTVTGSDFVIEDEDGAGSVTVSPAGGLSIQGNNYGVTLRPHEIGGSYRTDDGKTQISASVNPLGNDDFQANVGFAYKPADPITNNIQIDGSLVGMPDETVIDNSTNESKSAGIQLAEEMIGPSVSSLMRTAENSANESKSAGRLFLEEFLQGKR